MNDALASLRIDRSAPRRPQSSWFGKLFQVGLLVGLLAAAGHWAWQTYGEPYTRPQVKIAPVEVRVAGDADSVLSAQGYLKSEKQAAIGARVAGRVLKVYVKEGQPVAENAVLAELEHADLDATLEAMKASLDAQEASLEAMRVGLDKSRAELGEIESTAAQDERDFARAALLLRGQAGTLADYETANAKRLAARNRRTSMAAAVAIAAARLREAEARHRESQARYRETNEQRANMFVRAPFPGIVI